MAPQTQSELGIQDDEELRVKFTGPKGATLEHVHFKSDPSYVLEMHLDTDDANALLLKTGDEGEIIVH